MHKLCTYLCIVYVIQIMQKVAMMQITQHSTIVVLQEAGMHVCAENIQCKSQMIRSWSCQS